MSYWSVVSCTKEWHPHSLVTICSGTEGVATCYNILWTSLLFFLPKFFLWLSPADVASLLGCPNFCEGDTGGYIMGLYALWTGGNFLENSKKIVIHSFCHFLEMSNFLANSSCHNLDVYQQNLFIVLNSNIFKTRLKETPSVMLQAPWESHTFFTTKILLFIIISNGKIPHTKY